MTKSECNSTCSTAQYTMVHAMPMSGSTLQAVHIQTHAVYLTALKTCELYRVKTGVE